MYISEEVLLLVCLGFMFLIAGFAGVWIGTLVTKASQPRYLPATVNGVPYNGGLPAPIRQSVRRDGYWKSHVFQKVPYADIKTFIAQLNSRGIRLQSVTQANGDRHVTVYAEEWIPSA